MLKFAIILPLYILNRLLGKKKYSLKVPCSTQVLTVTVGQFCVLVAGRGHLLHISSPTMRVKGSLDLFIFMIHCYGKPSTVLLLLL